MLESPATNVHVDWSWAGDGQSWSLQPEGLLRLRWPGLGEAYVGIGMLKRNSETEALGVPYSQSTQ